MCQKNRSCILPARSDNSQEHCNNFERYNWIRQSLCSDIALLETFSEHPRDYVPVARFYRGMIVRRRMEGMRVFDQLHRDFRRALIEYLNGLDPRRVQVSTHGLGIQIRIAAIRPAVYDLYWQGDELCIEVDLAWWTPDGRLAPAPWRLEHRERIAVALG